MNNLLLSVNYKQQAYNMTFILTVTVGKIEVLLGIGGNFIDSSYHFDTSISKKLFNMHYFY